MKFDNRSSASAITSERGIIQISILALTTSIATATFIMAFLTYAPILTAAAAGQAVPSLGRAPNNNTLPVVTAIASNTFPTLGNPSVVYIESDKSSAPRPVSINGTHAQAIAFIGNGTLARIPVTDTGTAYLVTTIRWECLYIWKWCHCIKDRKRNALTKALQPYSRSLQK